MFGSMVGGRVAAGNDQQEMDLRESQLRSKGGGIRKWSVYSVDRHAREPTMPVGAAGKRSSFLMGRMAQGLSTGRIVTEERWARWARVFSVFDHNGQQWMVLRRGVNHPQSAFSATWNILGAAFIVMCVLFIPFEMTFDYETRFGGSFSQGFWHVMNPVMDVYFLLDLAVHFRTAFEEDGELVQDWSSIAKRYLLGWFVLDFLSSISSVLVYLMQAQEYGNLRNVRILRLVRLLKLLRIAKLKQILDNLDGVRAEMRVLAKLLKLLLMCLAITHMIACGFYMVAKKYSTDFAGSWVAVYYEGFMGMDPGAWKHARQLPAGTAPAAGSSPQSTEQQYLLSLYWAFITTTTVGYGDIAPRNDAERGFVIFTAFCGCATFAYITGEIAALANAKNQRDIEYESKQRAVADFMNYYDFPRELRARVRRFYDTGFETGRFIDARQILRDLSLELRSEVGRYMKKVAVTRTPAMRKLGEPAQLEVAQSLHSRNIHAGHVLINRGEPAEQLFILDKGEVDVMSQRPRREGSAMLSHVQYGLAEGSVFGFTTPGFDFGHAWQVDVLATTDCEYFYLSLSAYEDIAELFPEVGAALARADACLIKLTRSANLVRDLARAKTATKSSKDATPQEAHWLSPALAGQTRALGGAPPVGGTPNLTTGGSPPAQRSRLGILQPIPSERTFSAEAAREASAGRGVLQREDSMAFSKHLRRNSGERGGTRTNSFGAGGGAKAASVQHAMLAATAHAAHAAHAAAMDGHVDQLREAGEAHAAALKEHAVANIKALEERSAAVLDAAATHAAAAGGGQASRQLEASVAAMRGELAELSTEVRAMGPSMDAKMQALRDGVKRDVMAALGGFLKRSALLQATSDTPTTHV